MTAPGKVLNKAVAKTVAHNQALGKKAASKADDTNKIFVGNLALTVDSRTLRAKFDEKFGGVAKAQVIWDQAANASRGFGFVTFTDTALYEKALLETIGFEIGGRPVNITQCDQGNKTVCYAFKRGKCACLARQQLPGNPAHAGGARTGVPENDETGVARNQRRCAEYVLFQ